MRRGWWVWGLLGWGLIVGATAAPSPGPVNPSLPQPKTVQGLKTWPPGAAVYADRNLRVDAKDLTPELLDTEERKGTLRRLGNADGLPFQLESGSIQWVVLFASGYEALRTHLDADKVQKDEIVLEPLTPLAKWDTELHLHLWRDVAASLGVVFVLGYSARKLVDVGRRHRTISHQPRQDEPTFEGRTLDGYKVHELLGQGAFCKVYKGVNLSSGEDVAIKVLRNEHVGSQISEAMHRFYRETHVSIRHPNVILVYGAGDYKGRPYLVLELVEGTLLRDLLQPCLAVPEALGYLSQIVAGLVCVHQGGLVHRDLKPENIMVRHDGVLKIMDFGIAKHLNLPTATRTATTLGTPRYMSPEQVDSAYVDARSDLYSLGIILFEMLTGDVPFHGDFMEIIVAHIQKAPPRLRDVDPSLPQDLDELIHVLLQKKPADRPTDATALLQQVEAIRERLAQVDR